jgi:hypothetical protein
MSAERLREIWALPVLSQECRDGPIGTVDRDGSFRLRYDYETETGAYAWEEVTFSGVEAASFTAHESCSEEQVGAYDKLVEVSESAWIATLQSHRVSPAVGLRHFRIYFDEVGCYEAVATEFVPPPPREA